MPEGSNKGRVLVIDDDEIARQAICDLLRVGGYAVHPLASPIGATQVIATQGIVAAVIDLNMPVMSGDRFIALIRTWDRLRELPVVLISGESSDVVREAAAQLPGVAVVSKAQMSDLLVATVGYALMRRPPAASPRASMRTEQANAKTVQALAQVCLAGWRTLAARLSPSSAKLTESLNALRSEASSRSLPNTVSLATTALEIVQLCGGQHAILPEVDMTMTEMLSLLASVEPERERVFDRSLALTLHRSRLDRARQLLR